MLCFYHRDVEAVGICKSCGRAICHECCAEVGNSIGCRNRCEMEVEQIDDLRRRSSTLNRITGKLYYGLGVFCFLVGLSFFLVGLLSFYSKEPNPIGVVMGLILIAASVGCIMFARRVK